MGVTYIVCDSRPATADIHEGHNSVGDCLHFSMPRPFWASEYFWAELYMVMTKLILYII